MLRKHNDRERVNKKYTLFFFFIRTSNFGAEAERSYIFLRCEAENVLKMFLNFHQALFHLITLVLERL